MHQTLDLKLIVKHLTNGTLGEKLCRICLQPLSEFSENIYTKVCQADEEYCIADILKELCNIEFSASDHYNVCPDCFISASNAYRFYINTKRCDEVLHFYTDNMQLNLNLIDIPESINNDSLYISLPVVSTELSFIDIKPEKLCVKRKQEDGNIKKCSAKVIKMEKVKNVKNKEQCKKNSKLQKDIDDLVIIINEKGQPSFFKMLPDGTFIKVEFDDRCRKAYQVIMEKMPRRKNKKKRRPMSWKQCSKCPVAYRFVAKLRDHMKADHGIMLYSCKVCGVLIEGEQEFIFHVRTHTAVYQCNICCCRFKKRSTIISHFQYHEKNKNIVNNFDYVCIGCGAICIDVESFKLHVEKHNVKDYTCYYCGRMYKKEIGFNNHIKKHEIYQKKQEFKKQQVAKYNKLKIEPKKVSVKKEFTCELCGQSFLGQRALLWHGRLHTNERPYTCDVCGRGFVSVNRRNQHTLCAHTAPSRQCPLCPALFHMRSMVNSHIKKVHLRAHKRRTRTVRPQNVSWFTAPVPIQELGVDIQNDILELQAAKDDANEYIFDCD